MDTVEDALDAAFDEDGIEDESDGLVNQVLAEVGLDVSSKVSITETKQQRAESQPREGQRERDRETERGRQIHYSEGKGVLGGPVLRSAHASLHGLVLAVLAVLVLARTQGQILRR